MISDFKCPACGDIIEKLVFGDEANSPHYCKKCGRLMKKMFPNTMNFRLISNTKTQTCGWACDKYETNHYWDDHKKEK